MKNMKHMKHHLTNVAFVFLTAACNLGLLVTELCIAIIALRRHQLGSARPISWLLLMLLLVLLLMLLFMLILHAIRYATFMSWSGP